MRGMLIVHTAHEDDSLKCVADLINDELSKSGFDFVNVYATEHDEEAGEREYIEWLETSDDEEEEERGDVVSTHAAIGILSADSTVSAVYCHYDGYPAWTGSVLKRHYWYTEKVNELLALGNLSMVNERLVDDPPAEPWEDPMVVEACHRDLGEELVPAKKYASVADYVSAAETLDASYLYLFNPENTCWQVFPVKGDRVWHDLR